MPSETELQALYDGFIPKLSCDDYPRHKFAADMFFREFKLRPGQVAGAQNDEDDMVKAKG